MYGGRITSEEKSTLGKYIGLILVTALGAGGIYFFFLTQEVKEIIGFDPNRPVQSDAILKRRLKPEQYRVVRESGTQMPYQNEFWNKDYAGIYVDVITNDPLFTSVDKYDAGLGMPTFSKPNLERPPGRESRHFARDAADRGARQTKQRASWPRL